MNNQPLTRLLFFAFFDDYNWSKHGIDDPKTIVFSYSFSSRYHEYITLRNINIVFKKFECEYSYVLTLNYLNGTQKSCGFINTLSLKDIREYFNNIDNINALINC